jgi:hypothetical protein
MGSWRSFNTHRAGSGPDEESRLQEPLRPQVDNLMHVGKQDYRSGVAHLGSRSEASEVRSNLLLSDTVAFSIHQSLSTPGGPNCRA